MSGFMKVLPDRTYLWDTTVTTYAHAPVVMKGSTPNTVTNPAGTSADQIIGFAQEDAGPSAPLQAANATSVPVQYFGVVQAYAKGTIHTGGLVKIGPTIVITPAGYTSAITVYTVVAATQTAAAAQPYPIVGRAESESSADGDLIYISLSNLMGTYY